jgi:hypothetical protein
MASDALSTGFADLDWHHKLAAALEISVPTKSSVSDYLVSAAATNYFFRASQSKGLARCDPGSIPVIQVVSSGSLKWRSGSDSGFVRDIPGSLLGSNRTTLGPLAARINSENEHFRILQVLAQFKPKRKTRLETAGLNLEKL